MPLSNSENLIKHRFRGKYVPAEDGQMCLVSVQEFARGVFVDDGWETRVKRVPSSSSSASSVDSERVAVRRAQRLAFDFALSNPDLDAFFTLTYAPKDDIDRANYEDVYKPLKVWLSNSVQRSGMKYIMTCERHKKGGIHFHGLCNSCALRLSDAVNPHTNKPIIDKGKQVFNIDSWKKMGFSTCKIIGGALEERVKVAKYVTKYITKGAEKVGGRYIYHGGALARPLYVLGDSLEEFTQKEALRVYRATIEGVGEYAEYTFL